ncbi:hypothetical protein KSP39_PZI014274 [Platanthera zijinensis]|uniref:Transposase (putative) gypsy type domain-containing protein n=1 Tax=Platanthera zijinensis TaxID=2320716 RepID=A0AAP0BA06_9ASPA
MVSARTDAAGDFPATDQKKCKLSKADLREFAAEYMENWPVHVRLPLENERINSSLENNIAIPIDHFARGFKFPLLWEVVEIFEHYGVIPGQLAPNTVASIYIFIAYLRSEQVVFSLNIFRKIFSVRAITPTGGKPYKGIIYFYYRGLKVVNLPNNIHNWSSRYLMFEGDLGFKHTYPQERADSEFRSVKLVDMENKIVKFLSGARLDIDHYIPMLPSLDALAHQETSLKVPSNLPQTPDDLSLTQGERKKEISKRRKEDNDPVADYSSSEIFDLCDFDINQKDLGGNQKMK